MPLSSTQSLDDKAQNLEIRCSSKAKMSPFSVITCHRSEASSERQEAKTLEKLVVSLILFFPSLKLHHTSSEKLRRKRMWKNLDGSFQIPASAINPQLLLYQAWCSS